MYDIFWTPAEDISAWGTTKKTYMQFMKGRTYRGIPYGQPVHQGKYVGTVTTLDEFIEAVSDPQSPLYTDRGENTWNYTDHGGPIQYSPYYSNDCSGFVSAALGIKRHTTRDIGADKELFPVVGNTLADARPGDLLNSTKSGHVIMVYDVVYDKKGGKVQSVVTIEQTPSIIVIRSFGKDGINGSLADLQKKIMNGGYSVVRYKYIDDVLPIEGAEALLPETVNSVSSPSSLFAAGTAAKGNAYIDPDNNTLLLEGWALSLTPLRGFEYTVNGGAPHSLPSLYYSELTAPALGFDYFAGIGGVNAYSATINLQADPGTGTISDGADRGTGTISVAVWAVTEKGEKYMSAEMEIVRREGEKRFISNIESMGMDLGEDNVFRRTIEASALRPGTVTLNGWCAGENQTRFEIRVDDGLWYPVPNTFRDDVYAYTAGNYPNCRDCNGFYCGVDLDALGKDTDHTVTLRAVTTDGDNYVVAVVEYPARTNWRLIIGLGIAATAAAAIIVCAVLISVKVKKKIRKVKSAAAEKAEISNSAR
ncbi:MAG: hypothetical protein J5950_00625 [Clostridia bacterium]|nr:hypothetical protein [Clostridia bacterium]